MVQWIVEWWGWREKETEWVRKRKRETASQCVVTRYAHIYTHTHTGKAKRDEEKRKKTALSKTAREKVLLMIGAESAGYDSPVLSCGKNQLTMAVSLCLIVVTWLLAVAVVAVVVVAAAAGATAGTSVLPLFAETEIHSFVCVWIFDSLHLTYTHTTVTRVL